MSTQKYQIAFDDFGLNQKTNDRIIELIQCLPGSRVAIMMNGHFSPEEKEVLLQSGAFLDIHLDRYEEASFQNKSQSTLGRIFSFLKEYLKKEHGQTILQSWEEQEEDFREIFGKMPARLNSHEHVHFFPAHFTKALKLAREKQIAEIRFGKLFTGNYTTIAFILNVLRFWNQRHFRKSGLRTSTYLLSWDWFDMKNGERALLRYTKQGETEVVFHLERDEEYFFLKSIL